MCTLSKKTIDEILRKGHIYEVGGAVRDRLLHDNILSKDRDYLVTGINYDDLSGLLKKFGRVDLVGQSFGVIKFTQVQSGRQRTFDITLPRKERSTGSGHKEFEVSYDPALTVEDDLVRRDFTVNAMALALDSDEVIDPLGGRIDLEKRQLRMVYPDSFKDDPLRMLRAVQFAARFEFIIEPETFKAMRKHAALIKTVSPERIAEELTKLLTLSAKPSAGFRLMETSGLLNELLPELQNCVGVDQPGGYHKYDVFEHTLRVIDAAPRKLTIRLAALFHDINKPQAKRLTDTGATFYGHEVSGAKTAQLVLKRLCYSNEIISDVFVLVKRHMYANPEKEKGLRRLIRKVSVELIFDLLTLRRADVVGQGMGGTIEDVDELESAIQNEIDKKSPFSREDLVISGVDIMRLLDLSPGPVVGEILDQIMEAVLDDPANNKIETLETLTKTYYQTILNRDSDKGNN